MFSHARMDIGESALVKRIILIYFIPCRDTEFSDGGPSSRLRFVHKMHDVALTCPVFAHRKDKVRRALTVHITRET